MNKGFISDGKRVFSSGYNGLKNSDGVASYRIPALLKTKAGTLLAGTDERYEHQWDWGNIDMVVRRSVDNGKTWSDRITILDLPENPHAFTSDIGSAFLIDMALVQDPETERIFALYDMWPEMRGIFGMPDEKEAPYSEVDGKFYLNLYDITGRLSYTVREEGVVYDLAGNVTSYRVDLDGGKAPYRSLGTLTKDGKDLGNVFFQPNKFSPLRVAYTIYLWVSYSDDDGLTWSKPEDITPQVRLPWMNFFGISPGAGICLHAGPKKGRLVIPTYSTNSDVHLRGSQASRVIYSDDNGKTWQAGAAVNDGRVVEDGRVLMAETMTEEDILYQNTECVPVQLNNGDLKLFTRNLTGNIQVATSKDGGETWEDTVTTYKDQTDVYVQLSAIQVEKDGQEYVLLVNCDGPEVPPVDKDNRERINGVARLAKVNEDGSLEWISKKLIQEGKFAYNSVQQLDEDTFAVLYEHAEGCENEYSQVFRTFDWQYLIG